MNAMPKYRVYLSEGRQIDLDAESHQSICPSDAKHQMSRVDFLDNRGHVVASFSASALQGFTKTENLAAQKDAGN
jgi:hypothetical protein